MHIMWELPTNKPSFLFKNTQDFNQTTDVGPQEPISFIDNINLYFNCLGFVQDDFKRSPNGMSWGGVKSQIFVKMQVFLCTFYFTIVFQNGGQQICTHFGTVSIFISNPYIILKLVGIQNVVHYVEERLYKGH